MSFPKNFGNPHASAKMYRRAVTIQALVDVVDRSHLAFIGCIERLEELLDRETRGLKICARIDFEDFNLRKSHALLELSRASRSLTPGTSAMIKTRLVSLQAKLAENSLLLEQHLGAMREIAAIMIRTIEMDESDGTYSTRSSADRR
jgi:hypothetical protein